MKVKKTSFERIQKESTYALTRQFILEGKKIAAIAKEREMTVGTIISHVEKLAEEKQITAHDIKQIFEYDFDLDEAVKVLGDAIATHGVEKLKPLYEAAGEQYDYESIRLVRAIIQLS